MCDLIGQSAPSDRNICPIRHEMPTDRADPLAHQNIRDRFYGQDDPVAAKMMMRQDEMPKLEPPEDEGISSLWLGNMSDHITPEVSCKQASNSFSSSPVKFWLAGLYCTGVGCLVLAVLPLLTPL